MSRPLHHLRPRHRLVAALALAWLSSLATPVLAEEGAPSPAVREQAITKYKQGSQAYAERRYKDAIDLFLEADALVGENAALAYNTSLAYEAMGDDANALRWAREYLRRSPQAGDRELVQRIVDGLEARLQAMQSPTSQSPAFCSHHMLHALSAGAGASPAPPPSPSPPTPAAPPPAPIATFAPHPQSTSSAALNADHANLIGFLDIA